MARRASKISQLCAFVCLCASISAWSSEYHGQVFFGGVPVPGATVTVQKGDEQFSTVTDRQGLYEFPDLADGQWKIEIEMSGFSKLDGKVTVTPDAPQGNWELQLLGLEQLQLPIALWSIGRHRYLAVELRESAHLDLDLPLAVGKVWELIKALPVSDGGELLVAFLHRHRRTRHRYTTEEDLTVILRGPRRN